MAIERNRLLEILEDSYSAYYNIIKDSLPKKYPFAFRAEYFKRGEGYFISKKVTIYANEENEYAYVFSAPSLDAETVKACIDYSLKDALAKIKPHKEHQCSNIKAVFVADEFGEGALEEVQSRKFQKSYHLSFWGYSTLLVSAVVPGTEEVFTNKANQADKKYFKKLFSAEEKNQKKLLGC